MTIWDRHAPGRTVLDLGVYPVWFAQLWLGKPTATTALGSLTATGVD